MIKGSKLWEIKLRLAALMTKQEHVWREPLLRVPLSWQERVGPLWMPLVWITTKYWHIKNELQKLCPRLSGSCLRKELFWFFFFLRENQSTVVTDVDYVLHPTGLGMGDILNARETGTFCAWCVQKPLSRYLREWMFLSGVGWSPLIGHDLKVNNIASQESDSGSSVNSACLFLQVDIFNIAFQTS